MNFDRFQPPSDGKYLGTCTCTRRVFSSDCEEEIEAMREYGLCLTCREEDCAREAAEIDAEIAREELEALSADPEFSIECDRRLAAAIDHQTTARRMRDLMGQAPSLDSLQCGEVWFDPDAYLWAVPEVPEHCLVGRLHLFENRCDALRAIGYPEKVQLGFGTGAIRGASRTFERRWIWKRNASAA